MHFRSLTIPLLPLALAISVTGCGNGSSSGNGDSTPESVDSLGEGAGFDGYRFLVQGQDQDSSHRGFRGIAPEASTNDPIDADALHRARSQFTLLTGDIPDPGRVENMRIDGTFYATEDGFFYAETETGGGGAPQGVPVSNASNTENVCFEFVIFDYENIDNSAIAYNLEYDAQDDQCPAGEDRVGVDWSQIQRGDSSSDLPTPFQSNHVPVATLTAGATEFAENHWLVIDFDSSTSLVRTVPINNLNDASGPAENLTPGESGDLEAVVDIKTVAELSDGNLIVGVQMLHTGNDYAVAYYDRSEHGFKRLDDDVTLSPTPDEGQAVSAGDSAYIVIDNTLYHADSEGLTPVDESNSDEFNFVAGTHSHVIWSTGSTVRAVEQGTSGQGTEIESESLVESLAPGFADGWVYYTVAEGRNADTTLENPEAIAYNPSSNDRQVIANGQWIGASLPSSTETTTRQLDQSEYSEVFLRHGSDQMQIAAVSASEPAAGIVELGELPAGYPMIAGIGIGFGPQRLMTVVDTPDMSFDPTDPSSGTDFDVNINAQVLRVDTSEADSLEIVSDNPGSNVRAVMLF